MKIFDKMRKYLLVEALMFLVLGCFLLIKPDTTIQTIIQVTAAFLGVFGLFNIGTYIFNRVEFSYINHCLISGVLQLLFSIILFRFSTEVTAFLPIALGIVVVVSSCINMLYAVDMKSEIGAKWWLIFFYGLICMIAGVVIIINPFQSLKIITMACGIVMIVRSVGNIAICITMLRIKKSIKSITD